MVWGKVSKIDPMDHALEFVPFFIDCDLANDLLKPIECGRSDTEPVPSLPFKDWQFCFLLSERLFFGAWGS